MMARKLSNRPVWFESEHVRVELVLPELRLSATKSHTFTGESDFWRTHTRLNQVWCEPIANLNLLYWLCDNACLTFVWSPINWVKLVGLLWPPSNLCLTLCHWLIWVFVQFWWFTLRTSTWLLDQTCSGLGQTKDLMRSVLTRWKVREFTKQFNTYLNKLKFFEFYYRTLSTLP